MGTYRAWGRDSKHPRPTTCAPRAYAQANLIERLQANEVKLTEESGRVRELTTQLRARDEELRVANDETARV
jgi:hypothetical protein